MMKVGRKIIFARVPYNSPGAFAEPVCDMAARKTNGCKKNEGHGGKKTNAWWQNKLAHGGKQN